MRLYQIHSELNAIKRQLRAGKRQVCQEQLQRYAMDGTLPGDPLTLAYVRLTEAAQRCMVTCIGGDEATHEQAVRAYEAALAEWQQTLQGGVL
ncbi:MAG TPA: hypothetical protein PLU87_17025 [Sedimentisphaerales bacterium]|nr:hypothetical protein [Sedimentisphaerales bacterium]HRV48478.1 hypothetical protein [Sedimentisphaerales bacterium]